MRGITVELVVEDKTQARVDEYGQAYRPVERLYVPCCIVEPPKVSEQARVDAPRLALETVTVHFPKTFTRSLEGARVCVFSKWWRVLGDPQPYPDAPTRWNRQATCVALVELMDTHPTREEGDRVGQD